MDPLDFIEAFVWNVAWLGFLILFDVAQWSIVFWISFTIMMFGVMVRISLSPPEAKPSVMGLNAFSEWNDPEEDEAWKDL